MEYEIIYSKRKSIGLCVGKNGSITVRAPLGCPRSLTDSFVCQKRDWIEKQLEKAALVKAEAEAAGEISKEELLSLAKRLRSVLDEKLPYYASLIGVSFGRVTVRAQRFKWGSCSSKGNLSFNCLLMLAPEEVLDYVIVHELCHRKHMDHSKRFWALVKSVLPDHEKPRRWLKEHGGALMTRAFPPRD